MNNLLYEYNTPKHHMGYPRKIPMAFLIPIKKAIFIKNDSNETNIGIAVQDPKEYDELTHIDMDQLLQEAAYIKLCQGCVTTGPNLDLELARIGMKIE